VVFASLGSTFPVANRPVHMTFAGSMGRKSVDETLPFLLRKIELIANHHAHERGIIHSHTYKIGKAIYEHMLQGPHRDRVIFATHANARNAALAKHINSDKPCILISPSMSEGFSFDDDLARWQILAKCPYINLGDPQVMAKKEQDPDWYVLQTVSTLLQSLGRIVRSDTDYGSSYILDSDFERLFDKNRHFFPKWLTAAFHWPR
jgi:Rad3-related DNA helicase